MTRVRAPKVQLLGLPLSEPSAITLQIAPIRCPLLMSTMLLLAELHLSKTLRALFMQGFGVRLSPDQAGTPAFKEALMEVLTNPKYTAAARAMSVKIRARKNTPVQEAAGVHS